MTDPDRQHALDTAEAVDATAAQAAQAALAERPEHGGHAHPSARPPATTVPLRRTVHDARNGTELPGEVVRDEGDPPTGDVAADEAYDGFGATDDLLRAVAGTGTAVDAGDDLLGTDSPLPEDLPTYPWQKKTYRLGDTPEGLGFLNPRGWHPLVGSRFVADQFEWHGQIDTALLPELAGAPLR